MEDRDIIDVSHKVYRDELAAGEIQDADFLHETVFLHLYKLGLKITRHAGWDEGFCQVISKAAAYFASPDMDRLVMDCMEGEYHHMRNEVRWYIDALRTMSYDEFDTSLTIAH